ncbi:MAG TPA: macro domain-containing protein [Gemmatimonadales bacterium]|nr:macro domain-containing protein [Gemmatimonadales bacterium]
MTLTARIVDITTLAVDAIVNAANEELLAGAGVCGAIHRAAGHELALACEAVSPCPVGDARLTPGFNLPARYVIHAVGPRWHGGSSGEADLLASAYRASIRIATAHAMKTIAFPAISTGVYGYPLAEATGIAVDTVRRAMPGTGIETVIFACFSDEVMNAYRREGVDG